MAPRFLEPLPVRAPLGRYQKQAKELIGHFRAENPQAIRAIRQHHPRLPGRVDTNDRNPVTIADIRKVGVTPADAQDVVAHWHGFASWQTLSAHIKALASTSSPVLQFELAVEAIVAGKMTALKSLLRKNPDLAKARSTREHRATLLHYVAANGVEQYRQRTPKNIVRIARLLIAAGADVDADLDYGPAGKDVYPERTGSTTLGLAATSFHPAKAGVHTPLLEVLLNAGADINGLPGGWNPVIAALHNGRGEAAGFLARRGARLDLEAAAGTGRLDAVKGFFQRDGTLKAGATVRQMEAGFAWACEYGHISVIAFLLSKHVNVASGPYGQTGLHWAAYGGHARIVELLLKHNAPVGLSDGRHRAAPLIWALHGWCYPPPERKYGQHHKVVALLIASGAKLPAFEKLDRDQTKKLRSDSRMRTALGIRKLP